MEFLLEEWIRSTVLTEAEKLLASKPLSFSCDKEAFGRQDIKNSADTLIVHSTDKRLIQIIDVSSKFGEPNSY